MTQLSPHFSLEELTHSTVGETHGINNSPDAKIIDRLTLLCTNILEPIRIHFNDPVRVLSGYRCPELNSILGGVDASQHMNGEAADICIDDVSNVIIYRYILNNLPFDQLIAERLKKDQPQAGWIHISYVPFGGRKNVISCVGGKYVNGLILS